MAFLGFRGGGRWTMSTRRALAVLLLLALSLPVLAAQKKKSKFLANYPSIMKFLLFWWCVIVFAVMTVYIIDQLLYRYLGSAKVVWSAEHIFSGVHGREAYWAQLVDPTQWAPSHPVLQTADVRMAEIEHPAEQPAEAEGSTKAEEPARDEPPAAELPEIKSKLRPVALQPLKPGLGFILRHKDGSGPRAGTFFCARECTLLEAPADGTWRMAMRTVEAGAGYPFLSGTEESEVEMLAPAENGTIVCRMRGQAEVTSRCFRWWTALEPTSRLAAAGMLQAIASEVESSKKKE